MLIFSLRFGLNFFIYYNFFVCVAAPVLAEDAIKAALADYRLKQHDNHQEAKKAVGASN